jgi:hypothetical protein
MAGKNGRCVTEVGVATHKYWHGSGIYFRQPLDNKTIGAIEFWTGSEWAQAINPGRPLTNHAPGEHSLPNAVSILHTEQGEVIA